MNDLLVYIIDDDPSFVILLRKILQEKFNVKSFYTSEECLTSIKDEIPDLIICDYQLPGFKGFEFFETIGVVKNKINFILISGKTSNELLVEMLNLGLSHFVEKDKDFIQNIKLEVEYIFPNIKF